MSFFEELKRRNVIRIAVAYAIVSWLLIQIVGQVSGPLQLPSWTEALVIVLLGIGFPVALVMAWAFELTPEGMKREREVAPGASIAPQTGRRLDRAIIIVLSIAVVYFTWDKFFYSPEIPAAPVETVAEEPATKPDIDLKSVAVLPFENMSLDEANIPFTLGIHDDLLTHLSRIGSIKTISRTSVLQYADSTKPIPEIAAELGVATVLEGGVQRAGDTVRINVQLINAATDEHMWAETYDRQLTAASIFQIQSEIARAIARSLEATLSPGEQERIDAVPTENLAALEAFFLGRQAMARRGASDLLEAIGHFQMAIDLDPEFALAWSGLADTTNLQVEYSGAPPEQTNNEALIMAHRALELDSNSAEAHTSLANILRDQRKFDQSADAFKAALELNPNYVPARHWYSLVLRELGDFEGGMEQIREAIRLDPRSWVLQANLGTLLRQVGRPAESMEQLKKTAEMEPGAPSPHWGAGANLWTAFAKPAEAVDWFLRSLQNNPKDPAINAWTGLLYLDMDALAEAEPYIEESMTLGPESLYSTWAMALLATWRDEHSTAVELAERALRQNPTWHLHLAILRNHDLVNGDANAARARYKTGYPDLFEDGVQINRSNVNAAIDLALVLTKLGETGLANHLLQSSLEYADASTLPRRHWFPLAYGLPFQVTIHAISNRKAEALEALRQFIDSGERGVLWYWLDHDPNLDSIRNEPEFQAIRSQLRQEAEQQRELIRSG
jgi:TolB-like protein/Tfp pilus assembly protein PilF